MKIQSIDEAYFAEQKKPTTEADFDFISNPDGSCHFWFCTNQGVVLIYDDFSPEFGIWLCEECFRDYEELPFYVIVKDKRERPGEP